MTISKPLSNNVWPLVLLIWFPLSAFSISHAQDYTVTISTVLTSGKDKFIDKEQYRIREQVQVKVVMTNTTTKTLNVPRGEDYYRPQLFRDGQLVSYRKEVSERIEKLGKGTGSRITGFFFLERNAPQVDTIDLNYWYGPLEAGQYQLSLERIFFKQRVASNVVLFEVQPWPKARANVMAQGADNQTTKQLSLRGTVESVEVTKEAPSAAFIDIKLKMELVNTSGRPIILLRREFLFPGGTIVKTPEDFGTNKRLAGSYGGPSNDEAPEWAALRSSLDLPHPPQDETRTLMPGESWPLEALIGFSVPLDPNKVDTFSRRAESLPVIQRLSPVWLRVICEVWPFNVEPMAPGEERMKFKFGHKLQRRWNDFGILWLDTIYSEPIKVDLRSHN